MNRAQTVAIAVVLTCLIGTSNTASAATTGKIQGRIVAADSGEPLGFADVLLLPADTTLKRVGGFTNADGTYLLEAAPGHYTLQIRALSYALKRIDGVEIKAGELVPFDAALNLEAIQQKEVVVEATASQNTERSMLSARKKAAAVGDAVSAEQVRKSPDKDAAEVLRRVTGLSVSDGKYVFVRGLGERYSSTEVDGVRLASPEQNKRVVPLDLLPANLIENIVVQKTYTADRPGEFGGGDIQVHTRNFPGRRTWSLSVAQGDVEGATFHDRRLAVGGYTDGLGFGAGYRKIPDAVAETPVPSWSPANFGALAAMGRTFRDDWSPRSARTVPNGSYAAAYGDEIKLFGRSLGLVESATFSRSFDQKDETQRFYSGDVNSLQYDYRVARWTESARLGGISGLSYRLSPRHTLHLRGLYSNSADDEVRVYEGPDYNATEAVTGTALVHRDTRLLYVQRSVLSGTIEGQHEFARLLGMNLDWKITRSSARRQQPDRREYVYDRRFYFEGDTAHWLRGSVGRREFGDMRDNGWGTTLNTTFPYALASLGHGKVVVGYDRQTKARSNFYRRFNFYPNANSDREAPPDTVFAPEGFDSTSSTAWIEDATLNTPEVGLDNYRAHQRIHAGYLSVDVPLGRHARGNVGLRVERGFQNVESFALFQPDVVLADGRIDKTDWLPSGNVTVELTPLINLRLAASRTLSRPDLNELSPSPQLEYVGGMLVKGNPDLRRTVIDNYDVRLEAFPSLAEVLAVGVFYKSLEQPIEQVIRGGTPHVLQPFNSDRGHNLGTELEARADLGRLWSGLSGFSLNSNASFIASDVRLAPQATVLGTDHHPLQGQARYLLNGALSYRSPRSSTEASVLYGVTGRRLVALGSFPLPDIYEDAIPTLDVTASVGLAFRSRVKLSARNLLDPAIRQVQRGNVTSEYRSGRSYSVALSVGS